MSRFVRIRTQCPKCSVWPSGNSANLVPGRPSVWDGRRFGAVASVSAAASAVTSVSESSAEDCEREVVELLLRRQNSVAPPPSLRSSSVTVWEGTEGRAPEDSDEMENRGGGGASESERDPRWDSLRNSADDGEGGPSAVRSRCTLPRTAALYRRRGATLRGVGGDVDCDRPTRRAGAGETQGDGNMKEGPTYPPLTVRLVATGEGGGRELLEEACDELLNSEVRRSSRSWAAGAAE